MIYITVLIGSNVSVAGLTKANIKKNKVKYEKTECIKSLLVI